jgi:hypothetical protein
MSTFLTAPRGRQRLGSILVDHGELGDTDPIAVIAKWYSEHCNGEWEHEFGFRISTLDNPGWYIEVDIQRTELEGRLSGRCAVSDASDSWLQHWSDGKTLGVACGPKGLRSGLAYIAEFLKNGEFGAKTRS